MSGRGREGGREGWIGVCVVLSDSLTRKGKLFGVRVIAVSDKKRHSVIDRRFHTLLHSIKFIQVTR